jgi:hypothetical protein
MSGQRILKLGISLAMALCCFAPGGALSAPGPSGESLVGRAVPFFSLASDQDRLASYRDDYYGRHHLILTFFPAAFTPV